MFHHKLLELESELLAKEQLKQQFLALPPECVALMDFVEKQVTVSLAGKTPQDWRGWLSYRRNKDSLIVCRGRSFHEGGRWKAGLDVMYGLDTITEYERHFDVSPPQDLDHLLVNFGGGDKPKVFLWYGENLVPYRLVFMADVSDDPHHQLSDAVVEACTWILTKPKDQTLAEFLKEQEKKNKT